MQRCPARFPDLAQPWRPSRGSAGGGVGQQDPEEQGSRGLPRSGASSKPQCTSPPSSVNPDSSARPELRNEDRTEKPHPAARAASGEGSAQPKLPPQAVGGFTAAEPPTPPPVVSSPRTEVPNHPEPRSHPLRVAGMQLETRAKGLIQAAVGARPRWGGPLCGCKLVKFTGSVIKQMGFGPSGSQTAADAPGARGGELCL